MQVPSLGWEDPLEEAMATHSSILAWSIPWTEEPGGLKSMGSQELDMTEQLTHTHTHTHTHTLLRKLKLRENRNFLIKEAVFSTSDCLC